ncbi:MAG TPA: response regulator transcription factor [Gammaproteobacteria bacterium]|jgi:FixJ family two-component response regulator|nr:response regulator transcription factor [Gammaproteobacteria bacterium]
MTLTVLDPIVYIVDDDQAMVESLSWIIESIGLHVKTYVRAQDFLAEYDAQQHGCLLLDVRMPGISGPELQAKLNEQGTPTLPIIFISGHGDVPLAVRVMKAGAIDFLTKPFNDQVLIESINKALRIDKSNREKRQESAQAKAKFALLSPREIQVLQGIVAGKPNKVVSAELRISLKTVEAHRASVMKKMGVKSVPELVKLVLTNRIEEEVTEEE